MNKERFNNYMKNVLIPALASGSTIIMDASTGSAQVMRLFINYLMM